MEPSVTTSQDQRTAAAKNVALVCYAIHAIGLLFTLGTATIIAVIVNYVKRPDAQGTFVFSHHNWMIRTFWWGLAWTIAIWAVVFLTLGLAIVLVWIPYAILGIWFLYRLIKGWLRLNENREVY